jgi:cysteine desulfurase / selenocysteine lyase
MMVAPLNPALFHLDPDHLWLMHCTEGPVPRSVVKGVQDYLHKELRPWELRWNEDVLGIPQALREEMAKVLAANAADIALTTNTSSGIQTICQGLTWKAGDEVVAPLGEHPSNAWPWKALAPKGISFLEIPLWDGHKSGKEAWESTPPTAKADPENKLMRFIRSGARVVAVSWVRFQDGLKFDLTKLGKVCRDHDVCLMVDGTQGVGTMVPDLSGVNAFSASAHKGLLSPQGIGCLWTRPDFRKELFPTGTWLAVEEGVETDFSRQWVPDARRLEPGCPNLMASTGMLEALRVIQVPGVPAITEHIRKMQHLLLSALETKGLWLDEVQRLRELLDVDRLGSILAFHHGGRGPAAMQELLERGHRQGIYASVREGYLRIAFHGWHEESDIARIVEWLNV